MAKKNIVIIKRKQLMTKEIIFCKILAYFVGVSLCFTLVPLQIYLHKNHGVCVENCGFCHAFWHILQVLAQFFSGLILIHYARNEEFRQKCLSIIKGVI